MIFWIYLCMAQRKNGDPSCPAGEKNSVMMIMNDPYSRWYLTPQVRKEEGAELLRSLGAEHVVVTSKWTFDHYYYDSQNDANDHHYHGDDDRDKDGIWIMNILCRTQRSSDFPSCRADWKEELKELISKLNISVAFDAIAGEMTGTIMEVIQTYHHQHRYFVRKHQTWAMVNF